MINQRFASYFEETFFQNNPDEYRLFLESLEKPIPRSIRIKPGKEEPVKKRLEQDGWILDPTPISNVFSLDRRPDFDPLERRIGFSMDHLVGNFYIQELAAAHPVSILADWKVQNDSYLILDMASSPAGKTTQLAEYFPNSFIIANEPTRERIPQLLQNLDRMGSANVGVTLYPGQYWKKFSETFDRILLDAPCSGEGTLYKWTDAVKHWHIKNIRNIAALQTKLFDAALHALKVWGEMIYSTCSLNDLEDEWVLHTLQEKYPESFVVLYEKKFWPHKDKTGGFYVVKLRKVSSIAHEYTEILRTSNVELKRFQKKLPEWTIKTEYTTYEHTGKILAVRNHEVVYPLLEQVYFMRFWEQIGNISGKDFIPNTRSYRYIDGNIIQYHIHDAVTLDRYFRWENLQIIWQAWDGWYDLIYDEEVIAREWWENSILTNTLPTEWKRV